MEHVSSAHPTGKFPEKVENLKRWARFPGWNFRTECRVPFTFLVVCTSSRHGWAPRRTGVYDQMEQLFTNRKFHFCSHRISGFFFLNGKRPKHLSHVYVERQPRVCTTWPSFPFACRLLFIISADRLVVSRNSLSIRILWAVFICSFSILRKSQLDPDVWRIREA